MILNKPCSAIIFPGQGSQYVGMGVALADKYDAAKEVFDEVDEALGQDLFKVIKDGPESELRLTSNAQPALMAVSLAIVRVIENISNHNIVCIHQSFCKILIKFFCSRKKMWLKYYI